MAHRFLLGFVVSALCCCRAGNAGDETAESAIIGGTPELAGSPIARSTVLFTPASSGGVHGCTATILDGSHALTARHCLIGADDVPDPVLVFAPHFAVSAPMRPVTSMQGFSAGFDDDIAVLTFSGGLPAGYEPVTLGRDTRFASGTPVLQAGYGTATANGDGSDRGVLRATASRIETLAVTPKRYGLYANGHTTCSGDSGGPDFVTVGGALRQIGVHVGGDCAGSATSTDVHYYVDWILSTGAKPTVVMTSETADP